MRSTSKGRLATMGMSLLLTACGVSNDEPESTGPMLRFTEAADHLGLNFVHDPGVDGSYFMPESIGSGGAFLDYDNDGDLDVYLINCGSHNPLTDGADTVANQLFRQEANGRFVDFTAASGLADTGYGMGVAVGDIDNDGFTDVYVTNYGPDALYRNNGDGTFSNISRSSGISNPSWSCSATFFDYNLDGFLDLYVTNYVAYDPADVCMDRSGRRDYCGPDGFAGVPDVLYRNNGDLTFTDVSVESGIAAGGSKGLGVVSADFNGDGLPDLYVANDEQPNHLWINQGNGVFEDRALESGVALNELGRSEAGMGVAIGDTENDGHIDLFVTHLRTESNTLYRFKGEYGYQDDSVISGLAGPSLPYTGFGTGFLDYDHDGDLDLAVVNGRVSRGPLLVDTQQPGYWDDYAEPNLLFENVGFGQFQKVRTEASPFSQLIENSRGLLFGDIDNDGDLDLLIVNEGGPARLFLNEIEKQGNWLMVRAWDPSLKRDAIGAVVSIAAAGRHFQRLVNPGYSYLASNDHRVHFGLGDAAKVDRIEVIWPGGQREVFPGVPSDQMITLRKGESGLMSSE